MRFARNGGTRPWTKYMMVRTWLQPNRRAVLFGMLLPTAPAVIGLLWALGIFPQGSWPIFQVLGVMLLVLTVPILILLGLQFWLPRIGYRAGYVVFNVHSGRLIRVPLDVVEGFLLGQGPAMLPSERLRRTETTTVVVRLSEKAEEWSRVEVNSRLASWCDSYISIRGTWCEPLDVGVVKRLNRLLAEAKRELAATSGGGEAE